MRDWLWALRGALPTWAAVPAALIYFAVLAAAWGVSVSYHPLAPAAFQWPYLLALIIVTLLALLGLALRHSTKGRRARVWPNLAELGTLVMGFVRVLALVMAVVKGPKTIERVLFGETYHVPTAYRPSVIPGGSGQDMALVIDVCGPQDFPVYANLHCRDQAEVRYGKEVLTDDFLVGIRLQDAGATLRGDVLHDLGTYRPGAEPGEIVYTRYKKELRLWLDGSQRIVALRICDRTYGVNCTGMVRVGDRSLVLPVHDMQATASKAALRAAAAVWVEKIESWRCGPGPDCNSAAD